jgi:hypothetical protein
MNANNSMDSAKTAAPARKKSRFRKFLKFVFYLVLGFFALLIVAAIVFRLLYPPDRLKQEIASYAGKQLQRQIDIGQVKINILKGFEISDISVSTPGPLAEDDLFPLRRARIKKAELRYSLRGLLKRKLTINKVSIDSSYFDLYIKVLPINSLAAKKTKAKPLDLENDSLFTMPLDVALNQFHFKNSQFKLQVADSATVHQVNLGDFSLAVENVRLERGDFKIKTSPFTGHLAAGCHDTPFSVLSVTSGPGANDSLAVSGRITVNGDVLANGLEDIAIGFDIDLSELAVSSKLRKQSFQFALARDLSFASNTHVNVKQQRLALDKLALALSGREWIQMSASVDSFLTAPYMELSVDKSAIPVEQLIDLADTFLPNSLHIPIRLHNQHAFIELPNTTVKGKFPKDMSQSWLLAHCEVKMANAGLTANDGQLDLFSLGADAKTSMEVKGNTLSKMDVSATVGYDSVSVTLPDETVLFTGPARLNAFASVNDKMLPDSTRLSVRINNILGATLEGFLNLSAQNALSDITGKGRFILRDINTANLPRSALFTQAGVELVLAVNGLDSLTSDLFVQTDSLHMVVENEPQAFPPVQANARLLVRTDSLFKDFTIPKVSWKIANIMSGYGFGDVRNLGADGFHFTLEELTVRHPALLTWIPENLQPLLEDLTFSGQTNLTAEVNGRIFPDSLSYNYNATATVFTSDTNIFYPPQFLRLFGLGIKVQADVHSDRGAKIAVAVRIDSVINDQIANARFYDNTLSFDLSSADFKSVSISNGVLRLPGLKSEGSFSAQVANLEARPTIAVKAGFVQSLKDTIRIIPDMAISGDVRLQLDMKVDSAFADVRLDAKTRDLAFSLPPDTRVYGINSDINIHQKMDVVHQKMVGDSLATIQTPSEASVDYLIYRPYYQNVLPNISTVEIKGLEVAGYNLENLHFEILVDKGHFEMPLFIGSMYGGNIGGRMGINLAEGNLAEATYNITGHLSNINSELLLPEASGKTKKGIINANFRLFGKGLDPNQELEMRGYFYVTDIGSKVLYNLLSSVEQRQPDSGIGYTKTLINWGFKPKLVVMEVRHGYFYPSIYFSQPWYFPAKLSGGRVELARIPVMFFVQTAMQQMAMAQM